MNDEWSRDAEGDIAPAESNSLAGSIQHRLQAVAPFGQRLVESIDRFLPESILAGPTNSVRRARLTVATGFVAGVAVLLAILATTETASVEIRVASYSMSAVFLLSPLFLKFGFPTTWMQNGLIGVMCTYSIGLSTMTGGADSGGVLLALVIPLIAILLCGAAAGTIWSLVTCAGLTAAAVAVRMGFEAPVAPDAGSVAAWNLWAGVAGIVGALSVALTYEWLRETNVRDLAAAQQRADRAHAQQHEAESEFRAQLEHLVEERTRELMDSREQLRRADRLASVGTLAAGVAHQINNPVGAILIGAQFALTLDKEPDRERIYREALESNAENAERCGHIVQNLLRFTRNDSTEKTLLNLNDVVRESISGMGKAADRFDLRLCEEPLEVFASGIEVEQVVVNLARNAIESGQPESIAVEIRTERRGTCALLYVSDRGHGIKDDDRERIFDPFFTTRIADGGTGLGLSLVHGIIEEHGGSVGVQSKVGDGTRFSVTLPLSS